MTKLFHVFAFHARSTHLTQTLFLAFMILMPQLARAASWGRPTYSSPIAISPDDSLIWNVNPTDNSVSVIRRSDNKRVGKIIVGAEPQSIALTADGQYAYVANAAAGTVSIIQVTDANSDPIGASVVGTLTTGAEPWNIVNSPDGRRIYVANSEQDTITVINSDATSANNRTIIGHINLRNSLANDPDRTRHFQPRGLAVTADSIKLYVTRFLSFTRPGGKQGEDDGREGLVTVISIDTTTDVAVGQVVRNVKLASRITGFKHPGLTNAPDTSAFPNQLQSIVIRGNQAYLPNIAASPTGPLRFNLDTHAFVNVIDQVNSTSPVDGGATNLHLGARTPETGKFRLFFANPWAIAFTTQSGTGTGYVVSAASDLLVKVLVDGNGQLSFTDGPSTTRYIDLNEPTNSLTIGAAAGKNPQGIAITSDGTRAYVANFVSRNVSVVDLPNDKVIATVESFPLPTPGLGGATNLVGAEMFFSSRGHFDFIPGTNSLRERLSQDGWQSCSSCHFKGLTDGVIWQFNAGPRKSVPLNATFNPHGHTQQRLLNYSAIFDEVEDFEANIRNISGPGGVVTNANNPLDLNHGLLIGPGRDATGVATNLDFAPNGLNAFALPNANREQLTVTLPNSTDKIPTLTALREWVRNAIRTPNAPLAGFPNGPVASDIITGRKLFIKAGCVRCHSSDFWTISVKDFDAPPDNAKEGFTITERTPVIDDNPVGAQYLNRFLRNIASFNIGVLGSSNLFGNNIGAPEFAAPTVGANSNLVAGQGALGTDYNRDLRGNGFNVPSLLGIRAVPPYMHNGAAESLAAVVADPNHRTDGGKFADHLVNLDDQAKLTAFLETIDVTTAPVVVGNSTYSSPIALNNADKLLWSVNPGGNTVSVIRTDNNTIITNIPVGLEPEGVALTPDSRLAFVANAAGNSVTLIQIDDAEPNTFRARVDNSVGPGGQLVTGAEPWNIVCSPDGKKVFVANSGQDTITILSPDFRSVVGHVDLRNSIVNDPDRRRHFQPRGLAVSGDNNQLFVTRFLSFTKAGGRQGEDNGREGVVAILDIDTDSVNINDFKPARVVRFSEQDTGFKFDPQVTPPATNVFAFPNQLQSIVIRGDQAFLPNIAASPAGPLRFNVDTHAFVSVIDGVNTPTPTDAGTNKFLNLHVGAKVTPPGKSNLFFANPWAMAFTTQSGPGTGWVVSAASDILVKVNVDAAGKLSFTEGLTSTRFIDLNEPTDPATSGVNAGKNPQGIVINSAGTRAYVQNFVSRNVSVVDLVNEVVLAAVQTLPLPAPGSRGETNLVGAEMFFSSRGHFDFIDGTNSLRERLSQKGWQACSSCHFKGLTDGIIWQFNAGPRKSVPLNSTFSPHSPNHTQQRLLNYSAIFDEVEDFEANIRNISGPGPLAGGALDPNHGLLIGPNKDPNTGLGTNLNAAPTALNAFALANENREQVTVTLPGSPNKVPALTALREWVRNAVRTPNSPLVTRSLPGAPKPEDIDAGRELFRKAGCANCHGGINWTLSVKDFNAPPNNAVEGFTTTERTGTFAPFDPVGAQYLNRFLRDVGSFNIGVLGQGNALGNNVGADEFAAAQVNAGNLANRQDALGRDYNNDGRGIGFNVPSLLGLHAVPPYLHNGAAETLADVIESVAHRTDNGRLPDVLASPADRAKVVTFLESIDIHTVPLVSISVSQAGPYEILCFDSLAGVMYAIEGRDDILAPGTPLLTVLGTGDRMCVPVPISSAARFYRLLECP